MNKYNILQVQKVIILQGQKVIIQNYPSSILVEKFNTNYHFNTESQKLS